MPSFCDDLCFGSCVSHVRVSISHLVSTSPMLCCRQGHEKASCAYSMPQLGATKRDSVSVP